MNKSEAFDNPIAIGGSVDQDHGLFRINTYFTFPIGLVTFGKEVREIQVRHVIEVSLQILTLDGCQALTLLKEQFRNSLREVAVRSKL